MSYVPQSFVAQMSEALKQMNRLLGRTLGLASNPATGELRTVVGSGTITTVSTVTTVSGLTNFGTFSANAIVTPADRANWAASVRARIT